MSEALTTEQLMNAGINGSFLNIRQWFLAKGGIKLPSPKIYNAPNIEAPLCNQEENYIVLKLEAFSFEQSLCMSYQFLTEHGYVAYRDNPKVMMSRGNFSSLSQLQEYFREHYDDYLIDPPSVYRGKTAKAICSDFFDLCPKDCDMWLLLRTLSTVYNSFNDPEMTAVELILACKTPLLGHPKEWQVISGFIDGALTKLGSVSE